MSLEYLNINPEDAIIRLDKCVANGYALKDKINSLFRENHDNFNAQIAKLEKQKLEWINNTLEEIYQIFESIVFQYNFRDAKSKGFQVIESGKDKLFNLIDPIESRIDKLNEFRNFIFSHYVKDINFTVSAKRDVLIQQGEKNNARIKN